jgi:hypothetical protein
MGVGQYAHADAPTPGQEWIKSYTVSGRPEVHVQTGDGSVRVLTSDTQQVEFRVKTTGSAWGIGFSDGPKIESRQVGNTVELNIHVQHFIMGFNNRHIDIEVRMPRSADVQLQTGDGSIDIAAVDGDVRANTSDGAVNISQVNGKIEVSSSDGAIVARTLKGSVKLSTSNGSIRATELDGGCEASSSDGRVTVEGRFDHLNASSSDGSVNVRIASGSSMSSGWQVSSSDGSVEVAVPRDFKASLDVSTNDGHITLDLPVQVEGEVTKSHIRGTLNGGGSLLRIHSSDGSVRLGST